MEYAILTVSVLCLVMTLILFVIINVTVKINQAINSEISTLTKELVGIKNAINESRFKWADVTNNYGKIYSNLNTIDKNVKAVANGLSVGNYHFSLSEEDRAALANLVMPAKKATKQKLKKATSDDNNNTK